MIARQGSTVCCGHFTHGQVYALIAFITDIMSGRFFGDNDFDLACSFSYKCERRKNPDAFGNGAPLCPDSPAFSLYGVRDILDPRLKGGMGSFSRKKIRKIAEKYIKGKRAAEPAADSAQ